MLRTRYAERFGVVRLAEVAAPHVGDACRPLHGDTQLCAAPRLNDGVAVEHDVQALGADEEQRELDRRL